MAPRTKEAPQMNPRRGTKMTVGLAGNPMVSVGVKMAPLVKSGSGRVAGHYVCSEHLTAVKSQSVCQEHGEVCETTLAYDWEGRTVTIAKDELGLERDGRIELKALVDPGDVDPLYFEKPYALYAQDGQESALDLLAAALRESGRYAVGTAVLNKATKAIAVRWSDRAECLIAHACSYDARIAWDDVALVADGHRARPQLEGARAEEAAALIAASLADGFDFGEVADEYGTELEAAVEAAAKGVAPRAKPKLEPVEPVADLMAALRASVKPVAKKPVAKKAPVAA